MNSSQRMIIATADGSHTISIPDAGVTYHSTHGAIQESMHVFLKTGFEKVLDDFPEEKISLFEMGFGTGLNAYLTALEAERLNRSVNYTSVELFPLSREEAARLNYAASEDDQALFRRLHDAPWNNPFMVTPFFALTKLLRDLQSVAGVRGDFHLIYYDAFAPGHQPELWTPEVFQQLYDMLVPGGILTTYCSKSDVRRAMLSAGFLVEKLPGPPGKREILRAVKPRYSTG